jgi:hypothetical protein
MRVILHSAVTHVLLRCSHAGQYAQLNKVLCIPFLPAAGSDPSTLLL